VRFLLDIHMELILKNEQLVNETKEQSFNQIDELGNGKIKCDQ